MIRILLGLLATMLFQSKVNAEATSPRLSIHKNLKLEDLAPVYRKAPRFGIGFKTLTIEDLLHPNLIALDCNPLPKNRNILVNIWYPAHPHKDSMPHSAYYEVDSETDAYAKSYLDHTRRFRRFFQYQESVAETGFTANTPILEANRIVDPQAFLRKVPVLRAAPFAAGRFPIVFYHSGAQGGFEENAPLIEYLASQGIVVASVIGPPEEGGFDATTRSVELLRADVNLTLAELKRDSHFDTTRIAFLGFSIGAQHAMSFALEKPNFAAAVLLDTTYENQDFMGFPLESKKTIEERGDIFRTPLLILSGISENFGKNDRFRIYRPLKSTPALFIDFGKEVSHEDFTWHGLVNRASQEVLDGEVFNRAMQHYERVGDLTLDFLSLAFSNQPDWSRLPKIAKEHLDDGTFRHSQTEKPSMKSPMKVYEILSGEAKSIERQLKQMLAQNSVSNAELNNLIKQVRFTDSSRKALSICKSLPLEKLNDPVNCIAIALESKDPVSAKMFSDYFFRTRKKPGERDHYFKRIEYSDAEELKAMIGKERFNANTEHR